MSGFPPNAVTLGSPSFSLLPIQQLACNIYGVSVGTASSQAYIPAARNPIFLQFHNPDNGGNVVWICKALTPAGVVQPAIVPNGGVGGGMIQINPGGTITLYTPGLGAWNCIASVPSELTVVEVIPVGTK